MGMTENNPTGEFKQVTKKIKENPRRNKHNKNWNHKNQQQKMGN